MVGPVARADDWTDRSRGVLDLGLVAAGLALVILGVAMSLQDYGQELLSAKAMRTFGSTLEFDADYRLKYVPVLTWLVALVSVGGTWRWFRVRRHPRLKRHAARPMRLLVAGAVVLDLAFWADSTVGLTAPHAVRAFAIDPFYALGGFLVAGAAWRVRSLIRPLPAGDPDA